MTDFNNGDTDPRGERSMSSEIEKIVAEMRLRFAPRMGGDLPSADCIADNAADVAHSLMCWADRLETAAPPSSATPGDGYVLVQRGDGYVFVKPQERAGSDAGAVAELIADGWNMVATARHTGEPIDPERLAAALARASKGVTQENPYPIGSEDWKTYQHHLRNRREGR